MIHTIGISDIIPGGIELTCQFFFLFSFFSLFFFCLFFLFSFSILYIIRQTKYLTGGMEPQAKGQGPHQPVAPDMTGKQPQPRLSGSREAVSVMNGGQGPGDQLHEDEIADCNSLT